MGQKELWKNSFLDIPPGQVCLSRDARMCVELRDELYGGCWDRMQSDLEVRLRCNSLAYRTHETIKGDLTFMIPFLRAYERLHGVNTNSLRYEPIFPTPPDKDSGRYVAVPVVVAQD